MKHVVCVDGGYKNIYIYGNTYVSCGMPVLNPSFLGSHLFQWNTVV